MYDYTQAKMNDDAIRAISSIGLAHLGDAVYELLVRTYLCVHGKATGKGLHRATVELVRAPKQAELADWTLERALQEMCVRGWTGFQAEWVNKSNGGQTRPHTKEDFDKIDYGTGIRKI